ncbi:hypothetical protein RhiJN_07118 [Ceratobasidium sp. AG-Ba]|nr:hypothetical protein RhiJN_07118 [Ceratobasidium sp. AG-Ba]QRW07994.1 hypothetical protein RhiLY_06993 [Ceratobasidium sp. AG-Ba]
MRVLASSEVYKASQPPHSQASPSPPPDREPQGPPPALADMSLSPLDFSEFCTQIPMAIAMERHADIFDISAGADVTRYFDGTAEIDVSANPAALRYFYAFEVNLLSGDPKHNLNQTAHTASNKLHEYILFEQPYIVPNTTVYRCRFRLALKSFLFPRQGQTGFFQARVSAMFALPDPTAPGGTRIIRAPTAVHRFSLQVKVSPGSILNAVR